MTDIPRAAVMAVDEDPRSLTRVQHELEKRYGADYRIACESSPTAALATLRYLAKVQDPVAIVLADLRLRQPSGPEFLSRVTALHPTAKRALAVTPWDDRVATMSTMIEILAQGSADYFVVKPTGTACEHFHRVITEFLDEWTRENTGGLVAARIVAEEASPRTRELLDVLQRNNVPAALLPAASPEARELLAQLGVPDDRLPVIVLFDDRVLVDPSLEEIAAALGARATLADNRYDIVIVGAGPAGLGAAVHAASEGFRTLVVEREAMGGQAGTTSLIRNLLGFPRASVEQPRATRLRAGGHFRDRVRLRTRSRRAPGRGRRQGRRTHRRD